MVKTMYKKIYSDTQNQWLRDHYSNLGRIKTAEEFNRTFGMNKSISAIESHCKQRLFLHVTSERKAVSRVENAGRKRNIGDISEDIHGEPVIKTNNGWVYLKELAVGKKEGMIIVHLDGNVKNCNPDNLMHIDRATAVRMSKEHFWTEDKDLTKTGIIWCQLEKILKNSGHNRKDE